MGQLLERVRSLHPETKDLPITYAGRLDPMASGAVLVLVGEECKEKDVYLGVDKEYEIEIVLGLESDTADILGIVEEGKDGEAKEVSTTLKNLLGNRVVPYPAYSSKPVEGKPLWEWARLKQKPTQWPMTELNIKNIDIGEVKIQKGEELVKLAIKRMQLVSGDFRQQEVMQSWNTIDTTKEFIVIPLSCIVAGGSYMRSIPAVLKEQLGISSLVWSIHRTQIFI